MLKAPTYRETLYEVALDSYGYVTPADALEVGLPKGELPKLARHRNGNLQNVAYGLYRFTKTPASSLGYLAEAVKRVDDGAYLHGESVLELHGLADVNSRYIYVASPKRVRRSFPGNLKVSVGRTDVPVTEYEGIPCQPVADAILECRGKVEQKRLVQATHKAMQQVLLTMKNWGRVQKELSL